MHYSSAVSCLKLAKQYHRVSPTSVSFVTPIHSVLLAAGTVSPQIQTTLGNVIFTPEADQYARTTGLKDVLEGNYRFPQRGGLEGKTYSKLARLSSHPEVDRCNEVIGDLIHHQLAKASPSAVHEFSKVVGELHDNVASHARGTGFSCVQCYDDATGTRIEFAVADAGCGMLRNVKSQVPTLDGDTQAIRWCLVRGNTTASKSEDQWEQWLPDDALSNPYPPSVKVRSVEDHHCGEGLWKLQQLVQSWNGSLWIWSGQGCILHDGSTRRDWITDLSWQGVAIEFSIRVHEACEAEQPGLSEIEDLGRRLGL